MADQEVADHPPRPGDQVEYAFRQAGPLAQFHEIQHGQRSLLRRLEHDGAAGRERRGDFPQRHVERPVPRHDGRHHPNGFLARRGKVTTWRRYLPRRPGDLGGEARHIAQQLGAAENIHLDAGAQRLAIVQGLDFAEGLRLLLDQVGEAQQDPLPVPGFHPDPVAVLEGPVGRRDRAVHVLLAGGGDAGQGFAGGWFEHRHAALGRGLDERAVDVELVLLPEKRAGGIGDAVAVDHRFDFWMHNYPLDRSVRRSTRDGLNIDRHTRSRILPSWGLARH